MGGRYKIYSKPGKKGKLVQNVFEIALFGFSYYNYCVYLQNKNHDSKWGGELNHLIKTLQQSNKSIFQSFKYIT